jgi:hypothetical protein
MLCAHRSRVPQNQEQKCGADDDSNWLHVEALLRC